jgi:hypothetical protein
MSTASASKKIGTIVESLDLIEPLLPGLRNRVLTNLDTQPWEAPKWFL